MVPDDHGDDRQRPEEDAGVAEEAAYDRSALLSLVPHYYRGEMSQSEAYLSRLDLTVDWAIAVVTAILAFAFESENAFLLLVGMVAVLMFVLFDVRRYRMFDAYRARVRLLEENVFATAFDPDGALLADWREEIGRDLRNPRVKVGYWEALARRLRRIYLPLLALLGLAWAFRITLFVPAESWTETATIGGIGGPAVVGGVAVAYAVLFVVAFWPRTRRAKGELRRGEPGRWR